MVEQTERQLRESEERLRLAFWAGHIGFWSWDLLSQEVYFSPLWKAQLGYGEDELPDMLSTWEQLLHPADVELAWKAIRAAQSDPQRPFEVIFRLRHKSGRYCWILSRGCVYRDDQGKPVRMMGCHVDITQQKENEFALRESQEQLRMAVEGGRMGLWIWDIPANKATWNAREFELLGLPPTGDPIFPDQFLNQVHPEDRPQLNRELNRIFARGSEFDTEFRIVLPDGSVRWLAAIGRLYRDAASGKPLRMMGVNYDISARRQALKSVVEAHQFNQQIIASAREGIIVYDQDFRYRVWNHCMEEITGYSAADVLGKHPYEVFAFLKEHDFEAIWRRALQGETVETPDFHFDIPEHRRSGWSSSRYGPLRSASGEIIGIIGTVRDITDRKLALDALQASQQRFQLFLHQLPAILWTTDQNLTITSSVGLGLKALGFEPEQLVGKSLDGILELRDGPEMTLEQHRQALQGTASNYEAAWSGRYFQSHLEPLRDSQGKIVGVIGIALDITERRRVDEERRRFEAQLQQSQKLESLGILAGGIAHDFNNLLTSVLGYASLALSELPANSGSRSMIREIEKAAQRASDLARQMLAYSGKGKFVIEEIHLDKLVAEMAKLLQTVVSKNAELKLDLQPAFLQGDATQIRQIVMNLITNASDALLEPGTITIRTGIRFIQQEEMQTAVAQTDLSAGYYSFVEVRDTGKGIPEETVKRIFDPFFTTKFTGRGLGLASVLGIVRGHRGTIFVESRLQEGTLFQVVFPAEAPMPSKPQSEPYQRSGHDGQGTILVIEDDENILRFVTLVLKKEGYTVLGVQSAEEGLALFHEHQDVVRAVILDLTMPQMSGAEVAQHIRQIRAEMPVLIMSGFSEHDVTEKFSGLGIQGFLQKPFRTQELIKRLETALSC
jgi:two-component system cell cycle sensor histidine kinase/response regulator CckA